MEEKRHHKRLKIDVSIQLERLTEDGTTTYDYTQVEVTDVSRGESAFCPTNLWKLGDIIILRSRYGRKKCSMRSSKSCVNRNWRMEQTNMEQLL